jgi:hypothetical protein
MAKPHSYSERLEETVKTHPVLPISLVGFITDTYGKNEETHVPNSFTKALTLALSELKSLKSV